MLCDLGDSFALQLSQFSQLVFRSVSPSFANSVSQVSQIRVSQGFANTSFAVLRLFRKIRKVLQILVFASFRKYKFRKLSQIGFSFRKVSQVSRSFAIGSLLMTFGMVMEHWQGLAKTG